MGCGQGERDSLLFPTMKWTEPMLYKQRWTANKSIFKKGVKVKDLIGLIEPEGIRYLPL